MATNDGTFAGAGGANALAPRLRAEKLLAHAQSEAAFMRRLRREIHRFPELGFAEVRTAETIRSALKELGFTEVRPIAGTGTVVDLTRGSGPCVLLRADIDALPIQEQTGLPYASLVPGMMHACGHDAHTAMLLGTARLLRDVDFNGRVRLLFQPSEERSEESEERLAGAEKCIREGALDGVDSALALHQMPHLQCGTIAVTTGPVMAAADFFEIVIHGRAAHAGVNPEAGVDAIVVASDLIGALQTLVSRSTPASEVAVISICTIEGGTASNVIADRVHLTGTLRAYRSSVYDALRSGIRSRCRAIAEMHGARIEYASVRDAPPTVNDPAVTAYAKVAAERVFGAGNVLSDERTMGAEDFALFARAVPSCFALLGTRVEGEVHGLHSPRMILNEDALPLGAAYLAEAALVLLQAREVGESVSTRSSLQRAGAP